jgi:hypothetical protein
MNDILKEIELDSTNREHIISDILTWKVELEWDNRNFDDSDVTQYRNELEALDHTALCNWWKDTVGEWIASRQDCVSPPTVDVDTYIDYQLGLVIDGRQDETDYGFIIAYQ